MPSFSRLLKDHDYHFHISSYFVFVIYMCNLSNTFFSRSSHQSHSFSSSSHFCFVSISCHPIFRSYSPKIFLFVFVICTYGNFSTVSSSLSFGIISFGFHFLVRLLDFPLPRQLCESVLFHACLFLFCWFLFCLLMNKLKMEDKKGKITYNLLLFLCQYTILCIVLVYRGGASL